MRNILQEDMEALVQKKKNIFVRIELLDKSMKTVDVLEGETTGGDIAIDANSDVRRTFSLAMVVKSSSFLVSEDSKIWLDKKIRIFIGVYHLRTRGILWYPFGIFNFHQYNYDFDQSTSTLSLSGGDPMSEFNGERCGFVSGFDTQIPAGSDIRNSVISIVTTLGGVSSYLIEDIGKKVPYDLKFGTGSTIFNMLKELRDLYPGWEMFFDTEGVFVFKEIPTCYEDPIVFDEHSMAPLLISETINGDFTKVKNVTEVWGRCLDSDRYTETCTMSGSTYSITIENFVLENMAQIGFLASGTNLSTPSLRINNGTVYPIVDEDGNYIAPGTMVAGKAYVLRFRGDKFYYLGQYQIHAIVKEVAKQPSPEEIAADKANNACDNISYVINPDSPFCVEKIGEIRNVLSGGEYENIYSEDLAMQRAKYENWKTTRLEDGVSIRSILIPWLDVNQKIRYISPGSHDVHDYIIKSIKIELTSGTMTINAIKFYPLYQNE